MKISIAKDVALNNINQENVYEAIKVNDSIKDVINKIARQSINAIEDTIKLINEEAIRDVIEAMKNASHIYGVGASALVAKDLQYKLVRINVPVSMYMDSHTQLTLAANINSNEVAIGISHSGTKLETFKALEMAKKNGAQTMTYTRFAGHEDSLVK
ncbi:SIS domain-containing protein [Paramaledivibacter caminithermalis DSM 15212]|uniref:SIS domain-containing protein n=1 Tax=Paramaledivibacter caminithermalis (strain DSM 15212 / CIP 107654 / DViRD3) TaxID=1121301 RepID=A0A1M6SQ22_PARC5|nr:SIS domain-containing protein [Paramaledivibacter caminithermalis DSM 15212]